MYKDGKKKCQLKIYVESEALKKETQIIDEKNIKRELMKFSKETLIKLLDAACKDAWTCQNYWMVFTEKKFGTEVAVDADAEVFSKVVKAQFYRVKRALNLSDNIQSLVEAIKFMPVQWPSAGFKYEFVEVSEKKLVMRIIECPMGRERRKVGLPYLPCKRAGMACYESLAKAVNPKIKVNCLRCPPDPVPENVMCEWEFLLED